VRAEIGKRHEDKQGELASREKIANESNLTTLVTAAMSKDPAAARLILARLGPGQGIQLPPDLPLPAGEEDPQIARDREAGERSIKLAKIEADKETARAKIAAEKEIAREKIKSAEDIALDKCRNDAKVALVVAGADTQAKIELDKNAGQRDKERMEFEAKNPGVAAVKKDTEKKANAEMAALLKGQEALGKAIADLVMILAKPTTKETVITPAGDGGFKMKTTERTLQ
jgi:hypothetical protein